MGMSGKPVQRNWVADEGVGFVPGGISFVGHGHNFILSTISFPGVSQTGESGFGFFLLFGFCLFIYFASRNQ